MILFMLDRSEEVVYFLDLHCVMMIQNNDAQSGSIYGSFNLSRKLSKTKYDSVIVRKVHNNNYN